MTATYKPSKHQHWSSRLSFIMASAGAAVGLGNIWRFPYMAGLNGGGAFVLTYIGFVIVLGFPLMTSEVLVGRRGLRNPAASYGEIAKISDRSRWWKIAGFLPILTGFLLLSYYCVIAGWVLDYVWLSGTGTFHQITSTEAANIFQRLLDSPTKLLFWDTLIVIGSMLIIGKGLHRGLERAIFIMFPALIILVSVLIVYAIHSGSFTAGLLFLFSPDFEKLNANSVLLALGQAFFSLGIGTGIMLTYGTYVKRSTSIMSTSAIISITDTVVALVAGMTIFPIVFANSLAPNAGPSLIFKTLPVAFGQLPFGSFFATLFFIMLEFAALTSAIALVEPSVMFLMESFGWSRKKAVIRMGFATWIVSLGTVFSFNVTANVKLFERTFFENIDFLTSNIMLPLGGFSVAFFTGWVMYRRDTANELNLPSKSIWFRYWRFAVRFIAPIGILVIFAESLGIF